MNQKKSILKATLIISLTLISFSMFFGCKKGCIDSTANNYNEKAKKDDGSCTYDKKQPTSEKSVLKSGKITANETWTADQIYVLSGRVIIDNGVTLTIEPGTIIKGAEGQESKASALIISKGAIINAKGTVDKPIIFTSILDNILLSQKVGSNLKKTTNELWGGVVICGNAPVSTENGDTEGNIEGVPASEGYGKYGGNDAADNSGVLSYVSIRHGGISIGEGNELNALTLGGVGNGTTISNIEIYATLDDGIELFGGTVNLNDILVFYQGDDGIDIDQNYSGTISNFAIIHGDGIATDEAIEVDGPEGSTNINGFFTLANGVCKSEGTEGTPADFKSNAQGNVNNLSFFYTTAAKKQIKIRTKFDVTNCTNKPDAYSNLIDNKLTFTSIKGEGNALVYDGNPQDPLQCVAELANANELAKTKINIGVLPSSSPYNYISQFSWGAAANKEELN